MKLLKTLSLMALALVFTFVLSCSQKGTSEESEATDKTEVEAVEPAKPMDAAMDSTAMDLADSIATEVTDSASMEN